jgi:RecJ-like exonuclease
MQQSRTLTDIRVTARFARQRRIHIRDVNRPAEETLMKHVIVALPFLWAMPALATSETKTSAIADAQRGTMVSVQGTVDRITDTDEFRLTDESGSIAVYVGPTWAPVDVGDIVTVRGFVDDDPGPREIYARELTRADGSRVQFDHRYD